MAKSKFNKKLIPILALSFVNILGFTILLPVLPFIVESYGGSPVTYGVLIAAYPMFQFLGAPLLGSLSDKYGRRPVLLISQLGTLLSWVIFGIAYFVPNVSLFTKALPLFVIAFARIVDGITGGNMSVANAYLADITPPKDRTKAYGILGAIIGIGLMVGPAMGGLSNSFTIGYLGTIILSFSISLITLILMYYKLPESLPKSQRSKDLEIKLLQEINIFKKLSKYKNNRFISRLMFIRFFLAFSFSSYVAIIVLYIIDTFGLSSNQIGLLFLILGTFMIFNQAVVTPAVSKRFGDLKTFTIGQIALGSGMLFLIPLNSIWIYIPIAYLINLGFSLTMPTFKSLITRNVDKTKQGEITGLEESIVAATGAIAPLIAGSLYANIGTYSFIAFSTTLTIPHILLFARKHISIFRMS